MKYFLLYFLLIYFSIELSAQDSNSHRRPKIGLTLSGGGAKGRRGPVSPEKSMWQRGGREGRAADVLIVCGGACVGRGRCETAAVRRCRCAAPSPSAARGAGALGGQARSGAAARSSIEQPFATVDIRSRGATPNLKRRAAVGRPPSPGRVEEPSFHTFAPRGVKEGRPS